MGEEAVARVEQKGALRRSSGRAQASAGPRQLALGIVCSGVGINVAHAIQSRRGP